MKKYISKSKLKSFFQMCVYNSIYKPYIELFGSHDNRKLKYKISICLIFKNEAPFLKEWLDYHLTIGIDHFYLYDNESDDSFKEVIKPYIDKGVVTFISFPGQNVQFKAYEHCYSKYRGETMWLSFLDADEFICLKYMESIKDWIMPFDKYPAVNIHWLMFGTGGILKHDYNKNVIEQYFSSWEELSSHGKCLINTRYDIANFDKWYVHHHTYMYYKICGIRVVVPAVNQFGYICTINETWGGGPQKLSKASVQINHYFTKSWDIWKQKMNKTDVLFQKNPKSDINYFYKYETKCTCKNYVIQRFLIKMKKLQGIV